MGYGETRQKKEWTPERLVELALEYATICDTQVDFYTHEKVNCPKSVFFKCMKDPEYAEFKDIIKKEIIDISVPACVDLAKANVSRTLKDGLKHDATPDERKRADVMAMFVLKTRDGWRENSSNDDERKDEIVRI